MEGDRKKDSPLIDSDALVEVGGVWLPETERAVGGSEGPNQRESEEKVRSTVWVWMKGLREEEEQTQKRLHLQRRI